jgi:hypothetical protein
MNKFLVGSNVFFKGYFKDFVSKDIDVLSADIPAIVAADHRPHIVEVE